MSADLLPERALLATCPHCWREPGQPCTPEGLHLGRYLRAERRGLISRTELASVVTGLEVVSASVIVRPATNGVAA